MQQFCFNQRLKAHGVQEGWRFCGQLLIVPLPLTHPESEHYCKVITSLDSDTGDFKSSSKQLNWNKFHVFMMDFLTEKTVC